MLEFFVESQAWCKQEKYYNCFENATKILQRPGKNSLKRQNLIKTVASWFKNGKGYLAYRTFVHAYIDTCACQGVRDVVFSVSFVYVRNGLSVI